MVFRNRVNRVGLKYFSWNVREKKKLVFVFAFIIVLCITTTRHFKVSLNHDRTEEWMNMPMHYYLTGQALSTAGAVLEGNLHVYMRVFSLKDDPNLFVIRGFILFQLAVREKYMDLNPDRYSHSGGQDNSAADGHMGHDFSFVHDPSVLDLRQIKLGMRDSTGSWGMQFEYHEDTGNPVGGHYEIKEQLPSFYHVVRLNKETQYELFVEGWGQYVEVDWGLDGAPPYILHTAASKKDVYQVVFPPYGPATQVSVLESIIVHSIQHHNALGLRGMAIYCRKHLYMSLMQRAGLEHYIRQGRLVLIPWDTLPTYENWGYFDQIVVNQHALLNFAGRNAMLIVTDIDEFLALPKHKTIGEFLESGCMSMSIGCHNMKRVEVFPEAIESTWNDLLSMTANPVEHLTYRLPDPVDEYGKLLMDPDTAIAMSVHYGTACKRFGVDLSCVEFQGCAAIPTDCAWLAHYMNIFSRTRQIRDKSELIEDNSWFQSKKML